MGLIRGFLEEERHYLAYSMEDHSSSCINNRLQGVRTYGKRPIVTPLREIQRNEVLNGPEKLVKLPCAEMKEDEEFGAEEIGIWGTQV